MTKETQSLLVDDVRDDEQAGTTHNFIVGHEVVLADVQKPSLSHLTAKANVIGIPSTKFNSI